MERPAATNHPVHELLRRRWSPSWFADRPIEPEKLLTILEAGRWMASSYNEQPCRYILSLRQNHEQFQTALGCLTPGNQAWVRSAAVLLLTLYKTTFTRNNTPNRVALHDVGGASAAMTFQAMHMGLFVHQMSGIDPHKIISTYQVPDGFEPATAVAMGYPYEGDINAVPETLRGSFSKPRERRALMESIFSDRFGEPAPLVRNIVPASAS